MVSAPSADIGTAVRIGVGVGMSRNAGDGAGCGAGTARRPPGTGRMTVRSESSGSENGLSLMPVPQRHVGTALSSADRPKFQPQIGEIPRYMDREPTRVLHLLPMRAGTI